MCRPVGVVLFLASAILLKAGSVTTTPAYQTTGGSLNYIVVQKSDPPVKLHIHWDKGSTTDLTVTATPPSNANIVSDPSNPDTANDVYKIITLLSPALGKRTLVSVTLNHLGSKGENCTSNFNFGIHIFEPYIEEVSFSGTKYWQLTSDDSATTYSAPQWKDVDGDGNPTGTGEHNYATSFTASTNPKIGVKVAMADCSMLAPDAINLAATGSTGVNVPATSATVTSSEVLITSQTTSAALPGSVKFYDSTASSAFNLAWTIKVGASQWNLPQTNHTLYVTLADPVTSLRQETLFYIASKYANGAANAAAVTPAIWTGFSGKSLTKCDKTTPLTYYQDYRNANVTVPLLLANGDGECYSFAMLFLEARKVEGIQDVTNNYINIEVANATGANGFMVKNWTFNGAGTSGIPAFPYLDIPDSPFVGATNYNWLYSEVTDAPGVGGQNVANPASFFENHQIDLIGATYYDPSYGVTYASIENIPIDGLYELQTINVDEPHVNLDLNGNGNKTDLGVPTDAVEMCKTPAGAHFKVSSSVIY